MRVLTEHQAVENLTDGCSDCAIRTHSICAALDHAEVETLGKLGRRRSLKAGEPLIWEGDESLLVANVVTGMLKLVSSTADGREQVVGIVYPTDFIGRPFGPTSHHSVTAISNATVCVFSRSDFDFSQASILRSNTSCWSERWKNSTARENGWQCCRARARRRRSRSSCSTWRGVFLGRAQDLWAKAHSLSSNCPSADQ